MQLSPEVAAQLRARKAIIDQQELLLSALKLEFASYIQASCGVDITQEEYTLDLEKGTLEKHA